MARIVEVQKKDCMLKILESEKGIKGAEAYNWLKKVRELNPHIGNLDKIYPKERVLIPDTRNEVVSPKMIWENAFSQMPENIKVRPPLADDPFAYITKSGDSINLIAEKMFINGPNPAMPHSVKRAILLHNNSGLLNYLDGSLPTGTLVNLTTFKLTDYELQQWESAHSSVKSEIESLDDNVKHMFDDVDREMLSQIADSAKMISSQECFGVGLDDTVRFKTKDSDENTSIKDEIIVTGGNITKFTSYGLGAGSALANAGALSLAQSNALLQEIYQDAYKKFGEHVLKSPQNHMNKIESFLRSHPKWNQLMKNVNKTPNLVLPKGKLRPRFNIKAKFPNANIFKNHIVKVNLNPNTHRYARSLAKSLNGKISVFKGWGGRLTWGLPMILGGISIALAPPEQRVRTLFEEGFSIVGGAMGTTIGAVTATLGAAGISVLFGIFISPAAIFIAAFLVGGYLGYKLSKIFEEMGGSVYDKIMSQESNMVYNSMDQYLESFY